MKDGNSGGIRIVAVLGTARPENYTTKALALVIDEIGKHENIALDLIDPAAQDLPFPGADTDAAAGALANNLLPKVRLLANLRSFGAGNLLPLRP